MPSSPDIEELSNEITNYVSTKMYNASLYADIDSIAIREMIARLLNFISVNSWCNECCSNTFETYSKLKLGIESMGYYNLNQIAYINQFLAIPCNTKIIIVNQLFPILSQLETNILLDNELSNSEKNPLLVLAAIAYKSLEYWDNQASLGPGTWNIYMIPGAATDWIRPFWLYNMLGVIISMGIEIKEGASSASSMVYAGITGGISGSSSYAIFK